MFQNGPIRKVITIKMIFDDFFYFFPAVDHPVDHPVDIQSALKGYFI